MHTPCFYKNRLNFYNENFTTPPPKKKILKQNKNQANKQTNKQKKPNELILL